MPAHETSMDVQRGEVLELGVAAERGSSEQFSLLRDESPRSRLCPSWQRMLAIRLTSLGVLFLLASTLFMARTRKQAKVQFDDTQLFGKKTVDSPQPTLPSSFPKEVGGILFVVRTWHANYNTLLPAIMSTWGGDVLTSSTDDLLIVGDEALKNPQVLPATSCGNDHSKELCCKTGYSLQLAYNRSEGFSWIFVVDDDVYVSAENAKRALERYDPSKPIALGVVGCGPQFCNNQKGGFCGGGGYVLSRAAMQVVMANSSSAFQADLMSHLAEEESGQVWDDITVTCLLKRRSVQIKSLRGLYPWKLRGQLLPGKTLNAGYQSAINASDPLPIVFHYLIPALIHAVHKQFQILKEGTDRRLRILSLKRKGELASRRAYDLQLEHFLVDTNSRIGAPKLV